MLEKVISILHEMVNYLDKLKTFMKLKNKIWIFKYKIDSVLFKNTYHTSIQRFISF